MTTSSSGGMARGRFGALLLIGAALLVAGIVLVVVNGARGATDRSPASGALAGTVSQAPGPIDVGFCQDMAVHHAQAQLMASAVVTRADPEIRTIALSILGEQAQETGMMRGWLAAWRQPQLPSGPPMRWMSGHRDAHMMHGTGTPRDAHMPGMATQHEINRLSTASGRNLDIEFLQLMIRHHEGGIVMATDAAAHAHTTLVRSAAGGMVLDQTHENQLMLGLLHRLGAVRLPLQ